MVVELDRATQLGIPYVVLHPGACKDDPEEDGIRRIARALTEIHDRTDDQGAQCLLETTAGQGSCLGWNFQQLRDMIAATGQSDRLAICLDTCHLFAGGYDLRHRDAYESTVEALDQTLGLARVRAVHLNDSKKGLGSRVDRHEHIGMGCLGLEPFRMLLHDTRFAEIPMYLETPKGDREEGGTWDEQNMATLRDLAPQPAKPA